MAEESEVSRLRNKSGRPKKFRGPSHPVTVTLPERTLTQLSFIDKDRARAIVKVTEAAVPVDADRIEVVEVAPGLGIILVGPNRTLANIKGLRLVEVAPLRFLLTIPKGATIDSIELAIVDLLEVVSPPENPERLILTQLRDLMRGLRRRGQLSKAEMLFIDTVPMRTGLSVFGFGLGEYEVAAVV